MSDVLQEIAEQRRRIDELDRHIVAVLNERAEHVLEIRRLKREADMQIFDPERETQIQSKLAAANDGPLRDQDLTSIYKRILSVMKTFG